MAAAGRKLGRSSPTLCSSRSHSQAWTSLLRPRTLCTLRALTSNTSRPRCWQAKEMKVLLAKLELRWKTTSEHFFHGIGGFDARF